MDVDCTMVCTVKISREKVRLKRRWAGRRGVLMVGSYLCSALLSISFSLFSILVGWAVVKIKFVDILQSEKGWLNESVDKFISSQKKHQGDISHYFSNLACSYSNFEKDQSFPNLRILSDILYYSSLRSFEGS